MGSKITSDQWFKPGDKVLLVTRKTPLKTPVYSYDGPKIELGRVYCVEDVYEGPEFNAIMLVGCGGWRRKRGNPYPIGFPAVCFRKVEEVQLCVSAIQHANKSISVPHHEP